MARSSGATADDGGARFEDRLTPVLAKAGVAPTPITLLRHEGQLGLTHGETLYVMHVLSHKRGDAWPWLAVSAVAAGMGRDERNVWSIKESLIRKGYLRCRGRWTRAGRGADEHDLAPLFAQLERLAIEDAKEEALADFPPMTYGAQLELLPAAAVQRLDVRRRGKPTALANLAKSPGNRPLAEPGEIAGSQPGEIAGSQPGEIAGQDPGEIAGPERRS